MRIYLKEGLEHSPAAKRFLQKTLREQGYVTYARLLELFDVFLTDNPDVVGYMLPGKAKIVLNKNLSASQVSVIVRHELLHEFLTHGERGKALEKILGKGNPQLFNIAADFEISNRGYTPADKRTAKSIRLGGQILAGLVTEEDRPGWEKLTFEEMYQKLLEEMEEEKEKLEDLLQQLDRVSQKELEDLEDEIASSGQSSETTNGQSNASRPSEAGDPGEEEPENGQPDLQARQKAIKKLGELSDQAARLDRQQEESEDPFATPEEQAKRAEIASRARQIKDAFADPLLQAEAERETRAVRRAAKQAQAIRNIDRLRGKGINEFKLDLRRFIADQLEGEDVETYARENPSYEGSGFILPGRMERDDKRVPTISVYWDVSGSFSDPAKTEGARQAINTLTEYARNGDLIMNTFYHGSRVSDVREQAGYSNDANAVMRHIRDTKPDNVIIITDSDLSSASIPVQVPGAAWMLFYDDKSSGLIRNLSGKKQTKYYMVEYK